MNCVQLALSSLAPSLTARISRYPVCATPMAISAETFLTSPPHDPTRVGTSNAKVLSAQMPVEESDNHGIGFSGLCEIWVIRENVTHSLIYMKIRRHSEPNELLVRNCNLA